MKFLIALCASLASGHFLLAREHMGHFLLAREHMEFACNPKTKVGVCNSKDDVTKNCIWTFSEAIHGSRVDMTASADDGVAQICGPGKFTFAPMTCGHEGAEESRHAYKAETIECTTKEDCDCREVKLKHFAQCYSVDCSF